MGWIPLSEDANAIHDNVAGEIAAVTEKGSPVDADLILIEDSADSNNKKRIQVGNLPGGGSGDAWSDHTVVWDADTTNPSIGNGTLTGRYTQDGSTVHYVIFLKAGSTTTFGTGDWRFSLPVAAAAFGQPGVALIADAGSRWHSGVAVVPANTAKLRVRESTNGGTVHASNPMTWATNDELAVEITYEAA